MAGVRFCSASDGARIGYSAFGSGRPLVVVPGWWMSPEADRARPIGTRFWHDLPPGRRTITYDLRGVGVSGSETGGLSVDHQVDDLCAVADAVGAATFDLWCFHDSTAAGVTFAARFPERVRRLILYNPWAYVPGSIGRQHVAVWRAIIRADWALATRCFAQLLYPKGPIEAQESSTKAIRETQTPQVAERYLEYVNSYDVRDQLGRVRAPVLVISREGPGHTPLVPLQTVQEVARAIPSARLLRYDTAAAVCPYYEHEVYRDAIRDFLEHGLREAPLHPTLTAREIDVLRLVAQGKSNREIAEALVISANTVNRHVSHVLTKTGSANRAEAVLYAARYGLVG